MELKKRTKGERRAFVDGMCVVRAVICGRLRELAKDDPAREELETHVTWITQAEELMMAREAGEG